MDAPSIPKQTHSPAPWRIQQAQDILDADSDLVAVCYGEQADADARLIAAAPDLLAALCGLMDALGGYGAMAEALYQARAATDKAAGTESAPRGGDDAH